MKRPKKYSGVFQYGGRNIAFYFWLYSETNSLPDTVLFLGAGQVGAIPRWVAKSAGAGVVVVEGLPHWEAQSSANDVKKFSIMYLQAAFQTVLRTFSLSSMHVIAESQAVPAALALVGSMPTKVRNLAIVRPLGFTVQAFGDSERSRLRTFKRRILQTSLQLPQSFFHDPRNAGISMIIVRAMLREPNLASLAKKYAVGISYDLLDDCRRVVAVQQRKNGSFALLLGEKDKMFPPKEILAALNAVKITGINIEIIPGVTHSSLAVRASRTVLRRAIDKVREGLC